MHRAVGREQAQAAPLTRKLVDRMLEIPGHSNGALRDRALLVFGETVQARVLDRNSIMLLNKAEQSH